MNRFLVAVEWNYEENPMFRFSVEKLEKDSHELPEDISISYSTIFFFIAEIEAQATEEVMKRLSFFLSLVDAKALPIPKEWKIESFYYLGRIIIINGLPHVLNPYAETITPVDDREFKLIQL